MQALARVGLALADALGIDVKKLVAGLLAFAVAVVLAVIMAPALLLGGLGGGAAGVPAALGLWATGIVAQEAGGVPPVLVLGVIAHESGGVWTASHRNSNHTTDAGLMQVNSANWTAYGLTSDPYAPAANVRAGVAILAADLARYPGNVAGALEAYNAGTAANGWLFDPGYAGAVLAAVRAIEAGPHLAAWRLAGSDQVVVTAYAALGPEVKWDGGTWPGIVPPARLSINPPTLTVTPCAPVLGAGATCTALKTRQAVSVQATWTVTTRVKGPHGHEHTKTTTVAATAAVPALPAGGRYPPG